jgi:hypothetical protein
MNFDILFMCQVIIDNMCQNKLLPFSYERILWQWPYLIRACSDWISFNDLTRPDWVRKNRISGNKNTHDGDMF